MSSVMVRIKGGPKRAPFPTLHGRAGVEGLLRDLAAISSGEEDIPLGRKNGIGNGVCRGVRDGVRAGLRLPFVYLILNLQGRGVLTGG